MSRTLLFRQMPRDGVFITKKKKKRYGQRLLVFENFPFRFRTSIFTASGLKNSKHLLIFVLTPTMSGQ